MNSSLLIVFVLMTQAACANNVPRRNNKQRTTDAYPCCITDQFMISFGGTVGLSVDGRPEGIRVLYDAAFDFIYEEYGKDMTIYNYRDGSIQNYKMYDLIDENVRYIVQDSECYIMSIDSSPLQCVPDSASYVASHYLGYYDMWIDSWKLSGRRFDGDMSASTTSDCIPVVVNAAGNIESQSKKVSFVAEGTFMNFTGGIDSPGYWFTPPSSCLNATKIVSAASFKPLRLLKLIEDTKLFL